MSDLEDSAKRNSWPSGLLASSLVTPIVPSSGTFVTTQSLHLDVDIRVPRLPSEGHILHAKGAESAPGGGYIGAAASRAQGVRSVCASPLGTGPNSHAIRRQMALDGIESLGGVLVGDVGVGVSLVEANGKIATVIAPGVETETSIELLQSVPISAGDLVLVHGGDLAVPSSADVLTEWVPSLPEDVTVVVVVSPAVDHVPARSWIPVLQRANVLTMNIREADAILKTLSPREPTASIYRSIRDDAAVVRRIGAMGCDVQASADSRVEQIPAFRAVMVDTAGVGDTHVAVMCSALLQGLSIREAAVRANAAGALMVQQPGSYPPPNREDIDRVLSLKSAVPLASSRV